MESTQYKKPLFPVSRYQTTDEFRYYIAYGSTPAEDLLECVSTIKEPMVLLLGCGDLRSILYSIWKNFNASNSKSDTGGDQKEMCRFTRVKFVMTDYSAAVLARDILLLYLCVQRPKEEATKGTAKWLGAIWSIWYCHELLSHHERTLSSALSALMGFGTGIKAWSSSDNPIGSFVSFSSKYILKDVCNVWKMWQNKPFGVKSVATMRADRLHEKKISKPPPECITDDEPLQEYYGSILSKTKAFESRQEAMTSEVSSYEQTGTAFAECVLNESFVPGSAKTSVNHTFYERPDGGYSVYYDVLPFRSYHHTFQFSPSELLAIGVPQSIVSKLPIPEKSFEKYPLLANSVQQLALWLYSCASILTQCSSNTHKPRISFMFHCSEAIHFCRELQNSYHGPKLSMERAYDVIHTATLCEIVSLSNLLLYAIPLLKPDGLLYTATLKAVGVHRTTKAYVEHCTGVNTKLMPIIFGVRILNFDGTRYGSLLPATPEQKKLHGEYLFTTRNIIWKRVVLLHALCLSHLGAASDLCDSLIAALLTSVSPKDNAGLLISTKSAIRALQMFVAQAAVDPTDFNYWFRLCDLVGVLPRVPFMGGELKRFLPDLQMQAYLHGLHIHLAVQESCCPTCRGLRMYEFIGQYCIELEEMSVKDRLGIVLPYLHNEPLELDNDESTYHGISNLAIVREGKGSKKVKVHFHCPVTFDQNGYTVSLIDSNVNGNRTCLFSGKLSNYRVRGYFSYSFDAPPTPVPKHVPTSFGSLTSHRGNGHIFESDIAFSEKAFDTYIETKKLEPRRMSPYDIELSCGEHKISINYPYCIDYNSLSLKVSKKNKTVSIAANRIKYDFEHEIPLYMSDPNNPFLLPPMTFDKKTVAEFCRNQFNDEEFAVHSSPDAPPLIKMKNIIADLLQEEESFFFTYSEPGGSNALLAVNNRVFDYSRKTPAIDLSFCFAKHGSPVFPIWSTMVESPIMTDISLDHYELLERVLKYFAKRTAPLASPIVNNERLELLSHWKLSPCFNRAVVYPIYFNPDPEVKGLPTIDDLAAKILRECDPETQESYRKLKQVKDLDIHEGYRRMKEREKESKCSYCGKTSENLKKCTRCHTVQYCNKDCQQKHWKLHKMSCTMEPATATATTTATTSSASGTAAATTPANRPPTSTSTDEGPKPFISLGIPEILQCHYCSKILKMVKKCSGCLKATYCDRHCQEQHWKYVHKYECTAATLGKAPKMSTSLPEYSAFSKGSQAWREVNPDVKEAKCTYCSRMPSELIVCHCGGAYYCGTECRKSDWERHRSSCKCNNCKKNSLSLMMCPCVRAAYCDRTCQKKDWPNHKMFCPLNKKK